ncbi:MAG: energy-coupling factor transporter ATPase [Clostridia bacterium]|nr:energy-coupling factor transporter ATPase [Clostridia bacterium]
MSIIMKNVSYVYSEDTPFEYTALKNIDLEIEDGLFVGLIGHTGSGKSTLIQHFNGLLKPTGGQIIVNGINLNDKNIDIKLIRQKVGIVFQYPEYQLFEETVFKDVAFGPSNLGLKEEEIHQRVKTAIELTGLDYQEIKDKSPFELSGGQKRRVAIAGVLAMDPDILILDEPTAGLDPRGKREILGKIKYLHNKYEKTVILVSHSMEDIAMLVDRIIVMNKGSIICYDTPRNVFKQAQLLESIGLDIPQITKLMTIIREKGIDIRDDIYTVEQAKAEILKIVRSRRDA